MNDSPVPATCPRCGAGFACGRDSPAPCPCAALTLSAEGLARLRAQYSGCLCLRCLGEMAAASSSGTQR